MNPARRDLFRLRCRQFRWLALVMIGVVGLLVALLVFFMPVEAMIAGNAEAGAAWRRAIGALIWQAPTLCYLYAVWAISRALKDLSQGRLIQPTLGGALRRVGIALGLGGFTSVFVVTNLARMLDGGAGGYLNYDVAGMTLGMIGGALFLLAGVMEEAGRVQAELDEMI